MEKLCYPKVSEMLLHSTNFCLIIENIIDYISMMAKTEPQDIQELQRRDEGY